MSKLSLILCTFGITGSVVSLFLTNRALQYKSKKNISTNINFGQAAWNFILSIYEAEWDILKTGNNNRSFWQCVSTKFIL